MAQSHVSLEVAEQVLGYHFLDGSLGEIALQPWVSGFSRLEFLGDAILGLAIGADAALGGRPLEMAIRAVSNETLDELFFSLLAGATTANTGDVIEALVGAVHLDTGIYQAAQVAVQLCGWRDDWSVPVDVGRVDAMSTRGLAFVGAMVLSAITADHLCQLAPTQSHQWYSEERSRLLRRSRLAQLAGRAAGADGAAIASKKSEAATSDKLERNVARVFLADGWLSAQTWCSAMGVLSTPNSRP